MFREWMIVRNEMNWARPKSLATILCVCMYIHLYFYSNLFKVLYCDKHNNEDH